MVHLFLHKGKVMQYVGNPLGQRNLGSAKVKKLQRALRLLQPREPDMVLSDTDRSSGQSDELSHRITPFWRKSVACIRRTTCMAIQEALKDGLMMLKIKIQATLKIRK